ncbi:uncharacterized protein BJ212DRAFT_1302167 [Suillus subaureus]|uniref:Uncharacterized protein n=1 Tax=Suillus subaureus TaxID=48587 RepID=A0A9P7E4Q1_9AGAM|nr:uncharacterized protein BJ212DRAFT_1302167 [Suillus subaureus]KAG1810834.1 hypothetical protein BJ212DRAFT_1302167 [Suillus subaureus]
MRNSNPCFNGLEISSLADLVVHRSSCMSVAQQSLTSRMLRANANACAREKRRPALKIATASSSRPPNTNATQQSSGAAQAQSSSQPQAATSISTAPPVVANATSGTNPHIILRHAGRWTRFWLFICCAYSEYTDGTGSKARRLRHIVGSSKIQNEHMREKAKRKRFDTSGILDVDDVTPRDHAV